MCSIKACSAPHNWRQLSRHEFSADFGDMSEADFTMVVTDMDGHGFKGRPVLLYKGEVLDGWHQLRASVITNKQPLFEEFKGSEDEAWDEAWRRNGARRHYNESQRAMIGAKRAKRLQEKAFPSANLQTTTEVQEKVAAEMNVSPRSMATATKVLEQGAPALVNAVMDGTVRGSDAGAIVEQPKRAQAQAVRDVRKGEAPTARAAMQNRNPAMSDREKADARINRQHPAPTEANSDTVTCPMCKGKGHVSAKQAAAAKFITPTLEEVTAYCHERKNDVDPEQWMDHYTSNGWKVGKSKMVDWKAAVRTWEKSEFSGNGKGKKEDPIGTAQRWAEKGGKK